MASFGTMLPAIWLSVETIARPNWNWVLEEHKLIFVSLSFKNSPIATGTDKVNRILSFMVMFGNKGKSLFLHRNANAVFWKHSSSSCLPKTWSCMQKSRTFTSKDVSSPGVLSSTTLLKAVHQWYNALCSIFSASKRLYKKLNSLRCSLHWKNSFSKWLYPCLHGKLTMLHILKSQHCSTQVFPNLEIVQPFCGEW